ncbi:hypothetical protein C7293_25120 [filamentous cyanobacterium CCT1]|nr:hypothetical protein C7293_25120 [filamentous cyanobacterium CCT1]PSN77777.1 hypothetical protein C8B47_20315 [filamentous cyanobacterium CCP4]
MQVIDLPSDAQSWNKLLAEANGFITVLSSSAVDVVEAVFANSLRLLGFEGFCIQTEKVRPVLEFVADFSSSQPEFQKAIEMASKAPEIVTHIEVIFVPVEQSYKL